MRRGASRLAGFVLAAGVVLVVRAPVSAHPFIPQKYRVGTYPHYEGAGWFGELFLNIPDANVIDLRAVEVYVAGREADVTFRTPWIDFPAGPVAHRRDSEFVTIGDFLDEYVYDLSDPSKLDEPFGNLYLRFTGLAKIEFADESRLEHPSTSLPIWIDFGSMGYEGFRTSVGGTICYRTMNANTVGPWQNFGPGCEVPGLFPIEVTYFNRYDPQGTLGAPYAGFELYSWHVGGRAWPSGENVVHAVKGPMTLAPPSVIYQEGDEVAVMKGDFEADSDFDLRDVQGMQNCYGSSFILAAGCDWMDFDGDVDIDAADWAELVGVLTGLR